MFCLKFSGISRNGGYLPFDAPFLPDCEAPLSWYRWGMQFFPGIQSHDNHTTPNIPHAFTAQITHRCPHTAQAYHAHPKQSTRCMPHTLLSHTNMCLILYTDIPHTSPGLYKCIPSIRLTVNTHAPHFTPYSQHGVYHTHAPYRMLYSQRSVYPYSLSSFTTYAPNTHRDLRHSLTSKNYNKKRKWTSFRKSIKNILKETLINHKVFIMHFVEA